ncbi:MAG: hypothetical protein LAN64_02340 [Acidobacteriia bacterium]|nr:hypothetical protein [Terriglobia bacterium]
MRRLIWLALTAAAFAQGGMMPGPGTPHSAGATATITWSSTQTTSCYPATSCAFPGNVTAGNLIGVFAGWNDSTSNPTAAITASRCASGSMTQVGAVLNTPAGSIKGFYCVVTGTGAATVTLTSCGSDCGLTTFEVTSSTGFVGTVDGVGTHTPAVAETTVTTSTFNTTHVTAIVAFVLNENADPTWTQGTGFTLSTYQHSHVDVIEYRLNVAAGTGLSASFGQSNVSTSLAYAAAFGAN